MTRTLAIIMLTCGFCLSANADICKRAQQIYDSYLTAPRLYKTEDDGSRVYLSAEESAKVLLETKQRVDELCL